MPKIKTVRGIENRKVVSPRDWLAARKKLLAKEKKFSKLRDELSLQRRSCRGSKSKRNTFSTGRRAT